MSELHDRQRGLTRYAADLPTVDTFVSLGEGDTPVLPLPALAQRLKLPRLSAKMELLNPTGSYKDRVAAMTMSLALQQGKAGWIAASSGNAGMAMAAYGARAGLPGFLCLVAEAPLEKKLPLLPYLTCVVAVTGVGHHSTGSAITTMVEQVRANLERHNLHFCITANSLDLEGMRGVDTIAYELAEQTPDASHVYVPSGGGGLLVSIARGLRNRGMPARVICCQTTGCDPIVQCLDGRVVTPEIERCDSGISAFQIARPPDGQLAVDAVLFSGGWGTSVNDEAILRAQRLLAETEGIFVEPASAASLAALINDVGDGRLSSSDHPVLILSGAGWKDLGRFSGDAERLPLVDIGQVSGRVDQWMGNRNNATGSLNESGMN